MYQRALEDFTPSARQAPFHFNGILVGRVIRTDAANNCIDVKLVDGGIMRRVAVLQRSASTKEGEYHLPLIDPELKDEGQQGTPGGALSGGQVDPMGAAAGGLGTQAAGGTGAGGQGSGSTGSTGSGSKETFDQPSYQRDAWAVIGWIGGNVRMPVCLGFVFPNSTELSIKNPNRQYQEDDQNPQSQSGVGTAGNPPQGGALTGGSVGTGASLGSGTFRPYEVGAAPADPQGNPPADQTQKLKEYVTYLRRHAADIYALVSDQARHELVFPDGSYFRVGKPEAQGSDADARLGVGTGDYENLDKDKTPWKPKTDGDAERWALVHTKGARLVMDEKGRIHVRDYGTKDSESTAPDETDGANKMAIGDVDFHQRRLWRAAWGNPTTAPDQPIEGEHWNDPNNHRDRIWLAAKSDGQYHTGGGAGTWVTMTAESADGLDFGPLQAPPGSATNIVPGGRYGAYGKWSGGTAIDIFAPGGTGVYAPAAGTITFSNVPAPGAPLGYVPVVNLAGTNGVNYRFAHVAGFGTSGSAVTAGQQLGTINDPNLNAGFQHADYALSRGGTPALAPYGGNIDARSDLQQRGYPGQAIPTVTQGPQQMMAGSNDPFGGKGGATMDPNYAPSPGTTGGDGGFGGLYQPNTSVQTQPQWYMFAAVPKGGGVHNRVTKIKPGENGEDHKAQDSLEDLIDAAAADHDHAVDPWAADADIQDVGSSNKGGQMTKYARGDHVHKDAAPSDARLKDVTEPLTHALAGLRQITPVRFRWTEHAQELGYGNERLNLGVLAQDVEREFPELVSHSAGFDGVTYRSVSYKHLAAVLLAGLRELDGEVVDLRARVAQLEGK